MNLNDKRAVGGIAAAVLVAAVGGFSVARCSNDSPKADVAAKPEPEPAAPDTLSMTATAVTAAGIETETVSAGGLGAEIIATATVAPSPGGEALVTARAGGAVTRIFKRIGDPVRVGETLAIVESRDAAGIVAERSTANAKLVLAQKALARERFLYKERVSAKVELERAEAEAAAAEAELRRAQAAASAAGVTGDGRGVVVRSPISGRVSAESVTLGAFVQPEAELFRVSDASRIQVEAAIPAADAQRVASGDRAIVELPDGRTVDATVRSVTTALNGETRTATAVLDVPGGLQPGLAVRVRLKPQRGAMTSAIVLPEDSVQTVDGRDKVFVRTGSGFRAVAVTLGRRSAGRVEIVSGLKPGQQVATKNAFLLKAELSKGSGEEE
ncbi:MAG: efflux RND transporter periplasmic adaptor subunit [Sphingomonas sp.]|uniref:efflux RND transporter periplasmic adaptor subunit n=1 Tax=Sphingomonas sp. TaxID=28214 RepID=UPI001AD37B8E|nr:efflux RND transporter periplasmic adaptor subunit [Sphingomonas sp.]MBN8814524.1 efflux RND transporter periplasmic adaptor subunit [Sphingomonas sp.]MBS0479577.1 efflux RND transporter periplasmic adaptor subunit [Pseudomonadota bacterium]